MRTIAIINLKGGVAKTTSSINIAYILTQRGYKVLLVDNDKQGDSSRMLNRRSTEKEGIDRIMVDPNPPMEELIQSTEYENLDVITANFNLLTAQDKAREDRIRSLQDRIKKALKKVSDIYDFCVIDNAPDISISVINALAAADDVLIPIEIDDNTVEGMKMLLEQIWEVKDEWNPNLGNVRCLITKYNKYDAAHSQGAEIVESMYATMRTKIRRSLAVSKSTFARMPVALYSKRSAAAEDYQALVEEYLNMIGGTEHEAI